MIVPHTSHPAAFGVQVEDRDEEHEGWCHTTPSAVIQDTGWVARPAPYEATISEIAICFHSNRAAPSTPSYHTDRELSAWKLEVPLRTEPENMKPE